MILRLSALSTEFQLVASASCQWGACVRLLQVLELPAFGLAGSELRAVRQWRATVFDGTLRALKSLTTCAQTGIHNGWPESGS